MGVPPSGGIELAMSQSGSTGMEDNQIQAVIECVGDGSEIQYIINNLVDVVDGIHREYERVIQLVRMDFEAGEQ